MSSWQAYLDAKRDSFERELVGFLSIPSISALAENATDVQHAAEWVAARLAAAGMEHVAVMPTEGHPIVYGDWLHAEDAPTVMIYGHFDTQPVDPVSLWKHPPFEPTIEGDRIYARGATDDKGNLFAPILAIEALLVTEGALPVNVKCFFEGQEEIGSPHLPPFLAAHRDLLACDLVVSADGGQFGEKEPSITVGLRGVCGLQIDLHGPSRDLHSGSYGGAVQNPIHALVRLLDSMRASDGTITVDGFYDDVVIATAEERVAIAAVPFDEAEYVADLDVDELFGEPGYTPRERIWIRPTLEINGIWGGFQDEGTKTVLPTDAHAKITCRLVPWQDPVSVVEAISRHIEAHTPPGVRASIIAEGIGGKPYLVPADHPGNAAVRDVLYELYGREPYHVRMGGSIPVTGLFLDQLGASTVTFGFGLPDECVHSPNEFFRLSSFARGQGAYVRLLKRLAEETPESLRGA